MAATPGGGNPSRQRYLDDVAHRLGVTPGALSAALQAAEVDRIEEAVAAGRLSRARAQQLKQLLAEGKGPFFRSRFGAGAAGLGRTVQGYLGLTAASIRADRKAGKSLAQIADATPGKSALGLKTALEGAIRTRLATAASQGRITKAQEERQLARLPARLEALLNRTGIGPRRPLRFRHRHGAGVDGAPAPGGTLPTVPQSS